MDLSGAQRRITWALLAILNLHQVAASLNFTLYPREFADISCSLSPNEEGVCVYAYLCRDGVINTDGTGLVDLRFGDVCEDYFLRCCSKSTPCADNQGKCVPKDKCGVNKNLPKYKIFKQSQDCDWSGYTCCPANSEPVEPPKPGRLVTTKKPMSDANPDGPEKCDGGKGVCLSRNQCGVNPDVVGIIEERSWGQCSENQICCPNEYVKASECEQTGGRCVPAGQCSSILEFDVRNAESSCPTEGHVCCTSSSYNEKEGQACFNGGICTSRENCNGTVTKDRRNECNGLVCCTPSTSLASTTESIVPATEGKPCVNGEGTCTSRANCKSTVYKDKQNDCNGLVCCAQIPVTTLKPPKTTTENTIGKPCSNGSGQCDSYCGGTILDDVSEDCGALSCCASPTEATCADFGGHCLSTSRCSKRHEGTFEECANEQLVCCIEERKEEPTEYNSRGCGYRNDQGVRFKLENDVEGESQYGEFPWVVAIFSEQLESEPRFICGGSLIDPEVILTTADCVKSFRLKPEKLTIRAGEWDMRSSYEPIPFQERGVRLVKTHPSFKQTSLVNNVALLFLDDKFDLTNTIDTVCLPPQDFVIYNGDVTAAGWGSTPSNHTKAQQILKRLELPFHQRSDCERILRRAMRKPSFKLDESFFCAGGYPGEDTCRGDSGSPVVYPVPDDFQNRMYAVGMVSWGVGCGKPGVPAAYTDVGKFRNWIDAEVRKEGLQMHYYDYTRDEDDD